MLNAICVGMNHIQLCNKLMIFFFLILASLLDEMDPLSSSAFKANAIKTPQSFLGENSGLVNLDQLINAPNVAPPAQAYNPFGDIQAQPPKTNLFQQQAQPVCQHLFIGLVLNYLIFNFFINHLGSVH